MKENEYLDFDLKKKKRVSYWLCLDKQVSVKQNKKGRKQIAIVEKMNSLFQTIS